MVELKRISKKKELPMVELANKVDKLTNSMEEINNLTNGIIDIMSDYIVNMDGDE